MDDFALFDLNESKSPDNRSHNDIDPGDFNLFDISTTHSPQGEPSNIGTSADPCHDNSHKTKTDPRNENSYANYRIPACDTTPTAKEQTLEEGLALVKVDLDYAIRRWLEEGAEDSPGMIFVGRRSKFRPERRDGSNFDALRWKS